MSLVRITPPASLPLSLQEVTAMARLDGEDPPLIAGYLRAATDHVEQYLGRALITSSWQYSTDCFPLYGFGIRIPIAPVQDVTEVRYVDLAGNVQVLSPEVYVVSGLGDVARIHLAGGQSWPSIRHQPEAVTIDVVAGYGDDWNAVPEPIRSAIAAATRDLFDGCSSGVEEILQPYRIIPV
jgi:uncharacterized phiE125 gp8 family phage protein